jgi:hypothetical protein
MLLQEEMFQMELQMLIGEVKMLAEVAGRRSEYINKVLGRSVASLEQSEPSVAIIIFLKSTTPM